MALVLYSGADNFEAALAVVGILAFDAPPGATEFFKMTGPAIYYTVEGRNPAFLAAVLVEAALIPAKPLD